MDRNRIERKDSVLLGDAIKMLLKEYRMSSGHNTQRIFEAWDMASGASRYTVKRFYRSGKLYITVDSSVVRSQLSFQKQALIEKVNSILADDPLFITDDPNVSFVQELILK